MNNSSHNFYSYFKTVAKALRCICKKYLIYICSGFWEMAFSWMLYIDIICFLSIQNAPVQQPSLGILKAISVFTEVGTQQLRLSIKSNM